MSESPVRLTEYSHGAGCGCKIAPRVLDQMLQSQLNLPQYPQLLVGNSSRDDAAAYDLGDGQVILSTTDFFMPIVDDPFDFGRIAATNAISDIYAMGGQPLMAIAILGWPVNALGPEIASQVIDGGRQACADAGMPLAGGHSIDAPEPIFGLAVTGITRREYLKPNTAAQVGDQLYLTKPLGVGILSTAQKQQRLRPEHSHIARDSMCALNHIGALAARQGGVSAMTDVTGFGLMGHLLELCEGSGVAAHINAAAVPLLPEVLRYLNAGCVPGGTQRNFDSYGDRLGPMGDIERALLCDPQTSGGLLIAVHPSQTTALDALLIEHGVPAHRIGELVAAREGEARIQVEGELVEGDRV